MKKYTVIAIDLDEADTMWCHVEAETPAKARRAAMGKFLSSGPGDPSIQYVFKGHLINMCPGMKPQPHVDKEN